MRTQKSLKKLLLGCVCAAMFIPACKIQTSSPEDYIGPVDRARAEAQRQPLPPGETRLTVQDAILLGLENNRQLRIDRYRPQLRRAVVALNRAPFDPSFSADFAAGRRNAQGATSSSLSTGLTLTQVIPTGTVVNLTYDLARARAKGESEYTTRPGIQITQSLLKGFGTDANLAALRQARIDVQISQYELRGIAETLVGNIENAYWDYAVGEQRIKIYENSVALAKRQLEETRQRIDVGVLAGTELAAAEAEVAVRTEALINSRATFETARLNLLRLLSPPGPDLWSRTIIIADPPVPLAERPEDLEKHLAFAMKMRPDLNQTRLLAKSGDLALIITQNGLLPSLDVFVALGKTAYSDEAGPAMKNFGDNYDATTGLAFQYALGNRAARASHRRAQLTREQIDQTLWNMEGLVQVDVRTAYVEVNRALQQIAATAATKRLQEEKVRAETEKFRVGQSTSLLVAQAQRDLVTAQVNEIDATATFLKALTRLYRVEGSLLFRRGIEAPGKETVQ